MVTDDLELILAEADENMDKCVEHLLGELKTLRAGKASPSMLENIRVDYYGSQTPLSQMASVNAPQSDMLIVQPWDKAALNDIEKALQAANMGLNPSNDGSLIRIPIPPPTEERRIDLVKSARARGEDAKISARNVRRHAKEEVKSTVKEEKLSEDMGHESDDRIQTMTDTCIARIDKMLDLKEKEIMAV